MYFTTTVLHLIIFQFYLKKNSDVTCTDFQGKSAIFIL